MEIYYKSDGTRKMCKQIITELIRLGGVNVNNLNGYNDCQTYRELCYYIAHSGQIGHTHQARLEGWGFREVKLPLLDNEDIKALQHHHDSTIGLWCIDRNPSEVDLDWIREHSFQLKD